MSGKAVRSITMEKLRKWGSLGRKVDKTVGRVSFLVVAPEYFLCKNLNLYRCKKTVVHF